MKFINGKYTQQAIDGCGRLVFEIVHGVQGQWHSCGERIFTSFVLALQEPMYPHGILCQLLSQTLSHLLDFLSVKEHILLLWKILRVFYLFIYLFVLYTQQSINLTIGKLKISYIFHLYCVIIRPSIYLSV